MDKTKLLFIIPFMHEGGAQRALSNLQVNLPDGYDSDTILNSEANRAYPNSGIVVDLHSERIPGIVKGLSQGIMFIKRTAMIKKMLKTNRYKASISFVDSANIANIFATGNRKDQDIKTIVSIRTSLKEAAKRLPQYRYVVCPLARLLYKKADLVVAVSDELREELIDEYGFCKDKVISIPNGFDMDEIRRLSEEVIDGDIEDMIRGKKVVFTAGRLSEAKNQWHLIRAFSKVKATVPDSVLIIAGTGELGGYLKNLADGLKLGSDVIFLGFEANVYKYMKKSDAFVLPSGFEGFPNALGEALCAGAPCVATDFKTGAREIIAPYKLYDTSAIDCATECEYGILTPVCSGRMYGPDEPLEHGEMEMAEAIIKMISDNGTNDRYRAKSIERGRDFDITNTVKKWIEAIEA